MKNSRTNKLGTLPLMMNFITPSSVKEIESQPVLSYDNEKQISCGAWGAYGTRCLRGHATGQNGIYSYDQTNELDD